MPNPQMDILAGERERRKNENAAGKFTTFYSRWLLIENWKGEPQPQPQPQPNPRVSGSFSAGASE